MTSSRSRACIRVAAALGMIAAAGFGLATRWTVLRSWPVIGPYGGDAAWAMAACGGVRLLAPTIPTRWVLLSGFGLSVAVEVSQILQFEWLVSIRSTRVGALLLGRGFLWSDLVAYAGGVTVHGIAEAILRRGWPSANSSRDSTEIGGRETPPPG